MDVVAETTSTTQVLDANLAAIAGRDAATAAALRDAAPPETTQFLAGRDGHPTCGWTDDAGVWRWLGRTSMPSVSAPALVDLFQPGNGNVLLPGFGQGSEIRILLTKLAPHQAVFVVDPCAWAVALALRLHDFSAALRAGRLLVFTGTHPWDRLRDFLTAHDGFLTPERALIWPWLTPSDVEEITDRLHGIATAAAEHRAVRHARLAESCSPTERCVSTPILAVVSNVPDAAIRRMADRFEAGGVHLGWPVIRATLDDPSLVHPHAVERALREARPSHVIVLGAAPTTLAFKLPDDAAAIVVCPHARPLSTPWLQQASSGARLIVWTDGQMRQALEAGIDRRRVLHLAPAALPGLGGCERRRPSVAVVADGFDPTAEANGLNLDTHRHLWNAASETIRDRCDEYVDEHAERVVRRAEDRRGIRLESDEVRQGLVQRVRGVLGPTLVRRAYLRALLDAGVAFDLYGDGWGFDETLRQRHAGPWPDPRGVRDVLATHDVMVVLETGGVLRPELLDGLAGGLVGLVRTHAADATPDGLSAVLKPEQHVARFGGRAELIELVERHRASPDAFHDQARAAAEHVNAGHTWSHRLERLAGWASAPIEAASAAGRGA